MNSEWAEPPKDQGSTLATPGAQLKVQREAMGWSIEQIAEQLKLAPRQVVALENGDYAALPNMAVVRGFVRAYAKVVKVDATPLVAMIEVGTPVSQDAAPARAPRSTSFQESRFPSMTERSAGPAGWLIGVAVAVVVAAAGGYAYQSGLISPALLGKDGAPPAAAGKPLEAATPASAAALPDARTAPLQTPSVPLISVPPTADASAPAASTAAPAAALPAPVPPVPSPVPTPSPVPASVPVASGLTPAAPAATPAASKPAAAAASALVIKVREDSWVEIRRPGSTPLISRLVKAGSTETFEIKDPALLIVGKPGNVEATLGGVALPLPPVAGGTISRVNIK